VVKLDDFSMHQVPTSNMLRELQQQTGVEVRVLVCQTGPLPTEICPGLSAPVRRAVREAAAWVAREYFDAADAEAFPARTQSVGG
jgi:coenzyme F420 hydrogenase subunit delta